MFLASLPVGEKDDLKNIIEEIECLAWRKNAQTQNDAHHLKSKLNQWIPFLRSYVGQSSSSLRDDSKRSQNYVSKKSAEGDVTRKYAYLALAGCTILHWPLELERVSARIENYVLELQLLEKSHAEAKARLESYCNPAKSIPDPILLSRYQKNEVTLDSEFRKKKIQLKVERQRLNQVKSLALFKCLRFLEKALPHPSAMHNIALILESNDKSTEELKRFDLVHQSAEEMNFELDSELYTSSLVSLCGTIEGAEKALQLYSEAAEKMVRPAQYILTMRKFAVESKYDKFLDCLHDIAVSGSRIAGSAQYNLGILLSYRMSRNVEKQT